ncbi:hypothetical protein O7S54_005011, partial [Escherichia coli]|nr:hypothetical protein [Escherichia coli]
GAMAANKTKVVGKYTIEYMGDDSAKIYETGKFKNDGNGNVLLVNTEKGSVSVVNKKEISDAVKAIQLSAQYAKLKEKYKNDKVVDVDQMIAQHAANIYKYAIKTPSLKLENLEKITGEEI